MTALDRLMRQQELLKREVRTIRTQLATFSTAGRVRGGAIIGGGGLQQTPAVGSVSAWLNDSGSALTTGAVVVAAASGGRLCDTTTIVDDEDVLGVVVSETSVADGSDAMVRHQGYAASVLVTGVVAVGDWLQASATATRAQSAGAARTPGSFARALSASAGGSASIAAFVQGPPLARRDLAAIEIPFGSGGSVIATGVVTDLWIPYDLTVLGWTLLADQIGSLVLDLWKDTYANYPPTVADTVAGTEKPTLSAAIKNQDLALSTWTADWDEGDIVRVNVDSAATVTRALLALQVRQR